MQRHMYKSKIHMATVTEANHKYKGSITIDEDLLEASDIIPNEKVQVLNFNTGDRLETYIIKGKRGSGVICLNGPAARAGQVGDKVTIVSYGIYDDREAKSMKPAMILVDENNRIKK